MPGLDSNAIYTRCDVPAPERVSSSLSMLSHGRSICFGGFCLPQVTPTDKSQATMRILRCDLCVRLGDSKAKTSSSGGRLTAFSLNSQGFGGHDISVLFERIATRISRPICCISLTLGGAVSLLSNCRDNVTISLTTWEEQKLSCLLFRRSTNCNKSPLSSEMFFR